MHFVAPGAVLSALSLAGHVDAAKDRSMALFRPVVVDQTPNWSTAPLNLSIYLTSTLLDDKCPPCFNCLLPAFTCGQVGLCFLVHNPGGAHDRAHCPSSANVTHMMGSASALQDSVA